MIVPNSLRKAGKVLVAVVVIAAAIGAYAVGKATKAEVRPEEVQRPVAVEIFTATRTVIEDVLHTKGTLVAPETATVAPKMPGKIAAIHVDEGDVVKAGQVVAELEKTQLELGEKHAQEQLHQARAALAQSASACAQAQASLTQARSDYERLAALHKKGAVSQQQYDHAKTRLEVAEAAVRQACQQEEAARAMVAQAETGMDLAGTQVDDTKVLCPIDGVVTAKRMNVGEMGGPGDGILIVAYQDELELKADVSSLDLARIDVGTPVRLEVDGYPEPIETTITEISPCVDRVLRLAEITVRFDNRDRNLKPGMFSSVDVILDRRDNVIAIPKEVPARRGGDESVVFRVADDRAERVPVSLGIRQGDLVEVTGGLEEGDVVVTMGRTQLNGGERVIVKQG